MESPAHLRRLGIEDAPDVLAAFASHTDMERQGDVRTLAAAEAYVARLLSPDRRAVAVVSEGILVGLVVVEVDAANRNGWLSYWMHAGCRGRGWTSRAATTVADVALTDGGLERLELGHRANNPSSAAVARAAGFVPEGVERGKFLVHGARIDVVTYGRLGTDPWPTTPHLPGWARWGEA
ncbi:MAG: GNAT family N-acetyltransferase [Propionicimonas sp.]|uniref:GNAT family N-acetyltransferase n=1 Tax=Propionicimonas sp. TaxID=1955623 RepID=UPI003D0D2E14